MRQNSLLVKEINDLISQDCWSKNDALLIMVKLRQFIELFNLNKDLKYLKLYSDWAIHWNIDRSKIIYEVLELLSDSFIKNVNDIENVHELNDSVIEGLNLHSLLNDILIIGNGNFGITSILRFLDLKIWRSFAKSLIENLYNKSATFPNTLTKHAKPYYNLINHKTKDLFNGDFFFITGITYKPGDGADSNKPFVHIINKKGVTFVFEVQFINQQMVDNKKISLN